MTLRNAYAAGATRALAVFTKTSGIPKTLETMASGEQPSLPLSRMRPFHYPGNRLDAHTQGRALGALLRGPHPLQQETSALAETILAGAQRSRELARAALKSAGAVQGAAPRVPTLTPSQSSATAMPSAVPKPATQPTAPVAAGAGKANLLG